MDYTKTKNIYHHCLQDTTSDTYDLTIVRPLNTYTHGATPKGDD
jgi:hypothetical protein